MIFRESVIGLCRDFGIRVSFGEEKKKQGRRDQKVGEYCGGKDIEECRRYFGAALPAACSTCPE